MSTISVSLKNPLAGKTEVAGLIALEQKVGLTPTEIGRKIAEQLNTNYKTEASLYGRIRHGNRLIAESRLKPLANIFQVSEDRLRKINSKINRQKNLEVDLDSDIPLIKLILDIPEEVKTLGEFILWAAKEQKLGHC